MISALAILIQFSDALKRIICDLFYVIKMDKKQIFNPNIETNNRVQKQAINPKFSDGNIVFMLFSSMCRKDEKVTLFVTLCDI